MGRRKTVDKFINLGVDNELYEALKSEADLRGLPVTGMIRVAIWEMIERRKEREVSRLERQARALGLVREVKEGFDRGHQGSDEGQVGD